VTKETDSNGSKNGTNTLEEPGKLNKGGMIRKNGMRPEAWRGQRTYGNPMFNNEDEKTGGTDQMCTRRCTFSLCKG